MIDNFRSVLAFLIAAATLGIGMHAAPASAGMIATDVPQKIGFESHPVPATTNPLGVKGCGEAGCAGALVSVMNAIVDALGVKHFDMPASPERVWRALHGR